MSDKFPIFLSDLTHTQQTIASDTMPMAVAGIAAYAETKLDWVTDMPVFKYPEELLEALENYPNPRLLGFSSYIWNFSLSYEIAAAVKRASPQTVIVFGGPNYPTVADEQEEFLKSHPIIDFYIPKEGEKAFASLLDSLYLSSFLVSKVAEQHLSSIHCIHNNKFIRSEDIERLQDLSQIPSPYLTGKLDKYFDGSLMPILQTNRGCPFQCTFCVEGSNYYNKINKSSRQKVSEEIQFIGRKMAEVKKAGGRNDLFIADSNFGMYLDDIETCKDLAETRRLYNWPEYVHVATGKNKKERVLKAASIIEGALRLSGSVQSLSEKVLENIKRKNISADGLMDLALSASEVNANSYSEVILGLPGETKQSHFYTVQRITEAGFNNIYLFQLMLLPGSELANLDTIAKYDMQVKYRVLPRCYSEYRYGAELITSAEIESICVATDTLTFDDYFECRFMHLVVTMFYNDALYGNLLKLIRMYRLSVWRWIMILMELPTGDRLKKLYAEFMDATKNELWDKREDLEKFIKKPGTIGDYVDGKLGNNLLFVYKSLALTRCLDDLSCVAETATRKLFSEENKLDKLTDQFIGEASVYHAHRMRNLFFDIDDVYEGNFTFDFSKFEADETPDMLEAYLYKEYPTRLSFSLTDDQKSVIQRYKKMYGTSKVGIGRILSKVYLKKLFRHAAPVSKGDNLQSASENVSFQNIQISGLNS